MSAESFVDTSVFICLFDETDPHKRHRAERLVHRSLEDGSGCISYQVVQETLNVVTGKLGARPANARLLLEDVLIPLWRVNPTRSMYARGLRLQAQYGYSFYDSLIVAAALEAGCARLYSEDLRHGQRVDQLTIHNPFSER